MSADVFHALLLLGLSDDRARSMMATAGWRAPDPQTIGGAKVFTFEQRYDIERSALLSVAADVYGNW